VRVRPTLAIGAVGALLALSVSACTSGSEPSATTSSASSTSATASESTDTPTPVETGPSPLPTDASPLSGRAGGAGKPVLVVKFDNTHNAQPHTGLRAADIVYLEEVEYGLTRIAAVFSTELPPTVGPIRSARISDLELLAQYGHPAFSYSGSQRKMHPLIAASGLIDVSGDKGGFGYFRDHSRSAPYNFFAHPAKLMTRAPKASVAKDIGFQFAYETPEGGTPVTSVFAKYPGADAKFTWNAETSRYDIRLNGRPARATEGGQQHATTVVIQYVKQYDSGFGDKFGGRTPKEDTVGSGTAWVLRDGMAYKVRWVRPSKSEGTQFIGENGQVVPFQPGQIWIALVNRTKPVVFTYPKATASASASPYGTASASSTG